MPLYGRFAGGVCRCIRRWRDAPALGEGEKYWEELDPEMSLTTLVKVNTDSETDPLYGLYLKEKVEGRPCGPKFFGNQWPPEHNPRTYFPANPLYNTSREDMAKDWRTDLSFEEFVLFHRWCQVNVKCVPKSEYIKQLSKNKKRSNFPSHVHVQEHSRLDGSGDASAGATGGGDGTSAETSSGLFKFVPKKDGGPRFSKLAAAEMELDAEILKNAQIVSVTEDDIKWVINKIDKIEFQANFLNCLSKKRKCFMK